MSGQMEQNILVAVARKWLKTDPSVAKRFDANLFPVGPSGSQLRDTKRISVKYRTHKGELHVEEVSLTSVKDEWFIKSKSLCEFVRQLPADKLYLLLFAEAAPNAARYLIVPVTSDVFDLLAAHEPPLRLDAFDLPPMRLSTVETQEIRSAVHDLMASEDNELFGQHTEQFLNAPHILVPLFAHVLSLSSKDNIDFPVIIKTISDQFRVLLTEGASEDLRIAKVERNHARLWHDVLGDRIAFLDGGAARISGVPTTEPLALRVGIYSVCPGETDMAAREDWVLSPYVLGDLICPIDPDGPPPAQPPDPKRLYEAARYILEPLTALKYLETKKVRALLLHGPLVNQFTEYDEGDPNYLPALDPAFLMRFGISKETVHRQLKGIPTGPHSESMWNQFMAVYGAVTQSVSTSPVPIVGVIERSSGSGLTKSVLRKLVTSKRITESLMRKLLATLERYSISDDFLFGCVLAEGEYISPVPTFKNRDTRARDKWQEVVRQYPNPQVTILKTSSANFPFRIEMNDAALTEAELIIRLLYHVARLLPRYAFPVGLDIADKYAKVPDWLSRGVSARISAEVLRRALRTGDPNLVAQLRQFLARSPRDFFYRPQS